MPVDTSNCDQEPIHIPGFIQSHGMLFALHEPDLTVLQTSDNLAPHLGRSAGEILGLPIGEVFDEASQTLIKDAVEQGHIGSTPLHVFSIELAGQEFHALMHRYDGVAILELERAVRQGIISFRNLYALVSGAISRLENAPDATELCQIAAQEMRRLTGLDKVMIYLFDEEWTGSVVAEDRDNEMDAYFGLRFPASDIPRQARELYLRNKMRLISDVYATPVPVIPTPNPATGRSLDMSYSTLRSVSPIHIEYLKNMGVGASMSVSIVRDGRLAGLFACHHRTAKYLSYEVRTACEFLGQVLALQLGARERGASQEQRARLAGINADLVEGMSTHENFADGLAAHTAQFLELTAAGGAAVGSAENFVLLGDAPSQESVREILTWLGEQKKEVFASESVAAEIPGFENIGAKACGLLAISISEMTKNFIVWFRPEVVQTINWAGNPHKAMEQGKQFLHPRQSFEVWKESVRSRSLPWAAVEIEAATELRAAIVGIVLRQAEKRAQLSTELVRSNQELEAFSYSVSHDLRAPFRHILGFANMLEKRIGESLDATSARYLNTITDSAQYAGTLVDNLLAFSRMGRAEMRLTTVNMGQLVAEIKRGLAPEIGERAVEWKVGELPEVHGDLPMLRLVVQNLLSNAVKYSRGRVPAIIEVECQDKGEEWEFMIRDNGVGFDMSYVGKLFGVFQRLHSNEEFEGTGIGLANTRRIVTRHGGKTWAEGEVDKGASIWFTLPKTPLSVQAGETL